MADVFIYYSEFEAHQPVSIIPESPLESSSAPASAIDAVEDPVFTNFFSVCNVVKCYLLCFLVNNSAICMSSFTFYYMMMSMA